MRVAGAAEPIRRHASGARAGQAITAGQWAAAAVAAGLLHVYALSAFGWLPTDGAEAPGRHGITVDLGMQGDMGELMQTAAASPQAQPRAPEPPEEQVEKPQAEPVPQLPEQPRARKLRRKPAKPALRTIRKPRPKPVERKVAAPRTPTMPFQRQQPSVRSAAAARKSTGEARAQETGGDPQAELTYLAHLAAQLRRHKHYPLASRRRKEEGRTTLFLRIDRHGQVLEARISRSSGVAELDAAVLRMLERAKPLPPFTPEMRPSPLAVRIPVSFRLDRDLD